MPQLLYNLSMADMDALSEKFRCPYCGENNSPESEFCWACYKNLRVPGEVRAAASADKLLRKAALAEAPGMAEEAGGNSNSIACWGRFALIAGLFVFYLQWLRKENYFSLLDFVNLAFHEAGHLFLGFFGRFIMMSGGTVFQLLIPAVCAAHLRRQGNRLGWQLCVFWFGENLLNISNYAADAITQALPLVGGGEHDWTYLLTATHLIAHTPAAAKAIFLAGSAVIFWSLYLIGRDGAALLRTRK